MTYTVYILRTSADTLYIGQTNNLEKRLREDPEVLTFMKKVGMYAPGVYEIPEVREVTPGHLVRSGQSSAFDVNFGQKAGAAAVLLLLKGREFATIFTPGQLQSWVSVFWDLHTHGHQIAGIFFGLWLVPMGYLVFKSTYIPKIIGVFLIVTSLGYLIDFTTFFLYPDFPLTISEYTWLGEVLMVLWLLIMGVNLRKFEEWTQESLKKQPERTQ